MYLYSTIDHFTHCGSNVGLYAATLDIKKAFDKVNHYKLFVSLLTAGVPLCIVALLVDWYCKMFVMVKWNGCLSDWFPVHSGVRQGSILSPNLFTAFMNIFILSIRNRDLGCYVNRSLVSCILYADDVILLSASLTVLQEMLHVVHITASELLLEFNVDKSYGIAYGPNVGNLPSLCVRINPSIGVVQSNISGGASPSRQPGHFQVTKVVRQVLSLIHI